MTGATKQRPKETWATPILHADLDAFYASVEVLRDPSLAGKPVIVGGTSSRGVVTSASYEARKFGVHSAMPTSRARRLCPDAIFVQPDFSMYAEKSKEVRRVFDCFSPIVEPISLDEAFLDISGAGKMWPNPEKVAEELRDRVTGETGLNASVGVASNKFLAKLASKRAKPNGMIVVDPEDSSGFLNPLPVDALWGVGAETALILRRLGLQTIGDVAQIPTESLQRALGSLGLHIAELARGRDDRSVVTDAPRKSLGAEETYERDLIDEAEISRALLKLSDRVSSRLRARGISGQTVTLKVRFSNFTTITRSRTLPSEVDGARVIYQTVRDLISPVIEMRNTVVGDHVRYRADRSPTKVALRETAQTRSGPLRAPPGSGVSRLHGSGVSHLQGVAPPAGRKRLRLLGVSMSNLKEWPPSEQLSLIKPPKWPEADRMLDQVRRKFGEEALEFATLIEILD